MRNYNVKHHAEVDDVKTHAYVRLSGGSQPIRASFALWFDVFRMCNIATVSGRALCGCGTESARFRGNVTHPGALFHKPAASVKDVAHVLGSNPALSTLVLNVGDLICIKG